MDLMILSAAGFCAATFAAHLASIVIATALAAPLLKERVGAWRLAGAVAVAAGVVLLAG